MEIRSDKTKSEIISVVKTLLSVTDGEKDTLLEALLENAYSLAVAFTNAETIPSPLLTRMVCEDYSKDSGIVKKTRAGMSEEYINGYSASVISFLRSLKRLRVI